MTYFKKILIAFDQFINTIFNGDPDETISSRAYRWHLNGIRSWPYILIDAIFFWDKNHCFESYEAERLRKHISIELQNK